MERRQQSCASKLGACDGLGPKEGLFGSQAAGGIVAGARGGSFASLPSGEHGAPLTRKHLRAMKLGERANRGVLLSTLTHEKLSRDGWHDALDRASPGDPRACARLGARDPRRSRAVLVLCSRRPATRTLTPVDATVPRCAAVHVRELVAYRAYNTGVLMSQFPSDADVPTPGLSFGLVSLSTASPVSQPDPPVVESAETDANARAKPHSKSTMHRTPTRTATSSCSPCPSQRSVHHFVSCCAHSNEFR